MPNAPVLSAATGLPAIRPPLSEIMLRAHDYAAEMPQRLPYADRFQVALRRAWRDVRARILACLRAMAEDRVERLLAFLDTLDGDFDLEETADLEPSLGAYRPGDGYDAELDDSETGIGDLDGLWEQGHVAGHGPELLEAEAREARAAVRSGRSDRGEAQPYRYRYACRRP